MEISHKPEFFNVLANALAAYGKPLPEAPILAAWWSNLQPYPIRAISAAFQAYLDANGEFAPLPAGIALRCKQMDGRPGVEEAWAIALKSSDEANTVVWTAECAEAFALCQTVLGLGDEVGARMAFKEAYTRIVLQARSELRPVQWVASLGLDIDRRTAVLQNACNAGLLPAPTIAGLLPPPVGTKGDDANARGQIAKIKEMMAAMQDEKEREFELHLQREIDKTADAKAASNAMVANYKRDDAA